MAGREVPPFEVITEGLLSVDFVAGTFTVSSTSFVSTPELGLDSEFGSGTAIFGPDEVVTAGTLTWSGTAGIVAGTYDGTIPILGDGFGLGTGVFTVTVGTGDFFDWVGAAFPFSSLCGDFDAQGNAVYHSRPCRIR